MPTTLPKPFYRDENVTLYNADSRDVLAALPAKSIDLVFMDPPYGHNNNGGNDLISNKYLALGKPGAKKTLRPIANDGPEANDLLLALIPEIKRVLMDDSCCCCCCCGGGGPDPQFARWSLWFDQLMHFKQLVIWDKGPMGMGWHYRRSYETVIVAQRSKGKCRWYDESHRIENVLRPSSGIRKIIPRVGDHPTPKPPELAAHFMWLHSLPGHTVLDPFHGGGSTMIAAVRHQRKYIGVELSREFCELSIERLKRHYEQPKP